MWGNGSPAIVMPKSVRWVKSDSHNSPHDAPARSTLPAPVLRWHARCLTRRCKRTQLPVGEPIRILPLQRRKERLRFQGRIGAQLLADLWPHLGKAILPRPPMTVRFHLARQTAALSGIFRAVFTSIPAFDAAISGFPRSSTI